MLTLPTAMLIAGLASPVIDACASKPESWAILHFGCVSRVRDFYGIGQIGILGAEARREYAALFQFSFGQNYLHWSPIGLQIGLGNRAYEFYGGFQIGAHNQVTREMYSIGQIGLFNEVAGVYLGALQIGIANRWVLHRRNWAMGPLQISLYNEANTNSAMLGQIGIVNIAHEVETPFVVGVVNIVEDQIISLAQIGIVNRTRETIGLQIGVVNWTDRLRGVQIGLFNRSAKGGLPYSGILNVGW